MNVSTSVDFMTASYFSRFVEPILGLRIIRQMVSYTVDTLPLKKLTYFDRRFSMPR